MKKVLVYPCGTEIGLEVYRALENDIHYEIWGGSCSYDHGRFVYKKHIDDLPFITDRSDAEEIRAFDEAIGGYGFDFIYPVMDGVITVFAKYKDLFTPTVVAPDYETCQVTRSKRLSYSRFEKLIPVPHEYESAAELKPADYPVFMKPDVGQGSSGTAVIHDEAELKQLKRNDDSQMLLELLPGEEFTIDCFTNNAGRLVYFQGRKRKRIKGGISVNAVFEDRPEFESFANIINDNLNQRGAWFFQLKEAKDGTLKLLEIASRIAGTSGIQRCVGVNLPLLTLNSFAGMDVDDVIVNDYEIELDRALGNCYRTELKYDTVYVDYDDTLVIHGDPAQINAAQQDPMTDRVNPTVIAFLYKCLGEGRRLVLISRHEGDLMADMKALRIEGIFDEVIRLDRSEPKYRYVTAENAIFIDDSYGERRAVSEHCHINVFDVPMLECLM